MKNIQHKDDYKQTTIGKIPTDWEVKNINEVAKVETGSKNTQDKNVNGKYPFFVRSPNIEKIDTFSFDGEAILLAGDGDIGKVIHYINGKFDFHQRVYKISNFQNTLFGKYFYYYFCQNFIKQALKYTAKTTVDSVRMEMVTLMPIPLPPLAEQKKIADILSTWDLAIEKTQNIILNLKRRNKGLLKEIMSNKFLMNKGAKEYLLCDITEKIGDGLHGTPEYDFKTDFYFINGNNLINNKIIVNSNTNCISRKTYELHKKELNLNTILLSINGTIGNVAYYNGENVVLGKSVAYISCSNIIKKEFLGYLLQSPQMLSYFESELTGSTIRNLSLKSIRQAPIKIPSIPEQQAIADVLNTAERELRMYEQKMELLQTQKKGLMQKLLTGEVRVKING